MLFIKQGLYFETLQGSVSLFKDLKWHITFYIPQKHISCSVEIKNGPISFLKLEIVFFRKRICLEIIWSKLSFSFVWKQPEHFHTSMFENTSKNK